MPDLREWLNRVDRLHELRTIRDADPELEIGALCEINAEKRGPALLFDEIKGYEKGYRLLTSALITPSRMGLALGIEGTTSVKALVSQLEGKPSQWMAQSPDFSIRTR